MQHSIKLWKLWTIATLMKGVVRYMHTIEEVISDRLGRGRNVSFRTAGPVLDVWLGGYLLQ